MVSFISISTLVFALVAFFYMVINHATEQAIMGIGLGIVVFGFLYLMKENRTRF